MRWAGDTDKIEKAKKGSKQVQYHRRAMHLEIEAICTENTSNYTGWGGGGGGGGCRWLSGSEQ